MRTPHPLSFREPEIVNRGGAMADAESPSSETQAAPAAGAAAARSLKALCAVLALFALFGVVLGLAGFRNSMRVLAEARQIELARKAIDQDVEAIQHLKLSMTAAHEKVLQEVRQSVPQDAGGLEARLEAKLDNLEKETDAAIDRLAEKGDVEIKRIGDHIQQELAGMDERNRRQFLEGEEINLRRTAAMRQAMSLIVSEAGAANAAGLTPRERLLLALLAAQLDPDNPGLCLAAAQQAHAAGNASRATALIGRLLGLKNLDPDVARKARTLQAEIEKADSEPRVLEHQNPGRTRVGPYGIFDLHLNTLLALVRKGYLTTDEAQQILDDSKKQSEQESTSAGGLSIGSTRYVPVK